MVEICLGRFPSIYMVACFFAVTDVRTNKVTCMQPSDVGCGRGDWRRASSSRLTWW